MGFRFFDRFTSGLLVGGLATLGLASRIDSTVADRVAENWTNFAAVAAAIGAALLSLQGINRQIQAVREQDEERRLASLRAAKATLPLALSEIVRVSNAGVEYALNDQAFFKLPNSRSEYENATGISADTLNVLKSCIEFSDEQSAKWMTVVIQHYQVANARFLNYFEDPDMLYDEIDQAGRIRDWLIVKALVSHLFDFSRGAGTAPIKLEENLISPPIFAPWFETSLGAQVSASVASAKDYYHPFTVEKFVLLKDIHLPE